MKLNLANSESYVTKLMSKETSEKFELLNLILDSRELSLIEPENLFSDVITPEVRILLFTYLIL